MLRLVISQKRSGCRTDLPGKIHQAARGDRNSVLPLQLLHRLFVRFHLNEVHPQIGQPGTQLSARNTEHIVQRNELAIALRALVYPPIPGYHTDGWLSTPPWRSAPPREARSTRVTVRARRERPLRGEATKAGGSVTKTRATLQARAPILRVPL